MKQYVLWLFLAVGYCSAVAQTKINKSYPVKAGQTIQLAFDYPKIVRVSTWNGNTIEVEATVKINNGESNSAFALTESVADGIISVSNTLDMRMIPDSYYIVENGVKVHFNSKKDMKAYTPAIPGTKRSTYQQKDIEIIIHVKVPVNTKTELVSVYGTVEVQGFNGPITVDAKYGSIDASAIEQEIGKLKLTTRYGKIYTNMHFKPTEQTAKDFFTSITATPGKGSAYDFNASFGNIYLRNSTN